MSAIVDSSFHLINHHFLTCFTHAIECFLNLPRRYVFNCLIVALSNIRVPSVAHTPRFSYPFTIPLLMAPLVGARKEHTKQDCVAGTKQKADQQIILHRYLFAYSRPEQMTTVLIAGNTTDTLVSA